MRYGSVCSGIEAATVAWHPLGWRPAFYSEIDKFPRAVLAHHYPDVPLHGDFTTIREGEYEPIDLLVGGTPCQSFSIAGLRGGLGDARGNLALAFLQLARRSRARWVVWENVPGVLSSNGGRDFGSILGGLAELGYGFAYRVLDAQYFGVAQRRRRVFVVGHLGDWRRAAAVLFERESLRGDTAPRRQAGPGVAALTANGVGTCGADDNQAQAGHLIARALNAKGGVGRIDGESETFVTHSLRADGFDASENGTGRGTPLVPVTIGVDCYNGIITGEVAATIGTAGSGVNGASPMAMQIRQVAVSNSLGANSGGNQVEQTYVAWSIMPQNSSRDYKARAVDVAQPVMAGGPVGGNQQGGDCIQQAVAFAQNQTGEVRAGDVFNTLNTNSNASGRNTPMLSTSAAVRRLTPRECERLQGFPDDYTLIPYRNGMAADGPRYKALGNSMAVPVMAWIGRRITMVDQIERPAA
jgi:DNA (cytosine-5)-methyltransferase 1